MRIEGTSGGGATPPPQPDFPAMLKDFGSLESLLKQLNGNLSLYLKDPEGPNASEELTEAEQEMGELLTLFNPNAPNNFYSAARGNPQFLAVINNIAATLNDMNSLMSSGDLQGVLTLANSPQLSDDLTELRNLLLRP
jgi:hypothetical protein